MNRYKFFLLTSLAVSSLLNINAQNKTEFTSEFFQINLVDNYLSVESNAGDEIYTNEFINPSAYTFDIDGDGVDELFVIDNINSEGYPEYYIHIYNLLDTFYLAAEINSGIVEPYHTTSGEIDGLIIVTGNSDFSYLYAGSQNLNKDSETNSLPINSWKYEDGEIFSINDELYELFITENENLLSRLDAENINSCEKSNRLKPLLASVYINYLNAGENSSAENSLKTYYLCDDLNKFTDELNNLYYMEPE